MSRQDAPPRRYDRLEPCKQCPYRTDAPLAKWSPEEFARLLETERDDLGVVYGCHNADGNLCVGWALDQQRRGCPSIRLRLALASDRRLAEQFEAVGDGGNELYDSVEEMCEANLRADAALRGARR